MKIIDKTPYQDEKGKLSSLKRIQGTLEYGNEWPAEVEAQKGVIAQLDRVLEKGYTVIRNLNLANSKIIEPLILVGPPGVYVMYVTPVEGFFEAKGAEWNVVKGSKHTPAKANLLMRTGRLARAVQVFLNRQGVILPGLVDPVLICASPGVHVEQEHPIVRVVLGDAIKEFAASLLQQRPILKSELTHEVVDHLINPHRKVAASPLPTANQVPVSEPAVQAREIQAAAEPAPTADEPPRRARAIFHAAEETKPFDPADLSFDYDESAQPDTPLDLSGTGPAVTPRNLIARRGLSPAQWLVLVVMLLVEFAVLAGFVFLFLFGNP